MGVERLSDYNIDWIYEIINERQADMKTTIITSNMNMNDLFSHYAILNPLFSKRVISRVRENAFEVEFDNKPYR